MRKRTVHKTFYHRRGDSDAAARRRFEKRCALNLVKWMEGRDENEKEVRGNRGGSAEGSEAN